MLLAILLVLILIACLLAPWLIPAALTIASLYGAVVVVAGALVAFGMVGGLVFMIAKAVIDDRKMKRQRVESDERQRLQIEEGARIIREKERLASAAHGQGEDQPRVAARLKINCQNCAAEIDRGSMYCPACGKSPRAQPA